MRNRVLGPSAKKAERTLSQFRLGIYAWEEGQAWERGMAGVRGPQRVCREPSWRCPGSSERAGRALRGGLFGGLLTSRLKSTAGEERGSAANRGRASGGSSTAESRAEEEEGEETSGWMRAEDPPLNLVLERSLEWLVWTFLVPAGRPRP